MKDHEKRELVDELTMIAKKYSGSQQLRERIAHRVLPAIEKAISDERTSCSKVVVRVGTDVASASATDYIAAAVLAPSNVEFSVGVPRKE